MHSWSFNLQQAHSSTAIVKVNTIAKTQDVGSAVYLGNKRFLSAYHVIEDADSLTIVKNKKSYFAKVVSVSIKDDLAIIESAAPATRVISSIKHLVPGEKIYTLSGDGILFQGYIAKVFKNEVVLDQVVSPGVSGGGVFNQKGELIGIVSRSDIEHGLTYITRITAVPLAKERFVKKSAIDHGSKNYSYDYCNDPKTLQTWKSIIADEDINTQGLHALFLGLCEKVKRKEMTTEEANYFFIKMKKQLFGV